ENPSDVLAYNHLGAIYLEKKDYEKSIASFRRGLQIDPNHPILNYNLARCFSQAKMYSDSIRCFQNALKAKPGWVDAIKDFSNVLVKCQKSREASELVKHSIELHPNDTKLLAMLGHIYLEQYDYDSAEKTFKRAKKVDDHDIQILTGLAEALEKGEKPDEALEAVLDAIEIFPDDKDLKKRYVQTLLSANQIDAAGTNVKELYDVDKEDPQVLDLYGQYLICKDQDEKAESCFKKINNVNRNYKDHLLSAAGRYNQVGKTETAEKYAKEFVARDMRNPSGYNMLGKIYTKEGNLEQAIEYYDKSRNLRQPNILADKQIDALRAQLNMPEEPEDAAVIPEPAEGVEGQEENIVATEPVEGQETETEGEEGFDFGTMGDNVPMQEALQEQEGEFFDDDEEPEEQEEPVNTDALKTDEEVSPFDDTQDEPLSDKEKLVGAGDGSGSGDGDGLGDGTGEGSGSSSGASDNYDDELDNQEIDTSAGFEKPKFTGDGEREEDLPVSDMLDNVDSDSFDFDQFDETTATEEPEEEPEFDVSKMPDPFTASPEEMGIRNGMEPPANNPPAVPESMPKQVQQPPQTPQSYAASMMDTASMAMDTAQRASELAQHNALAQEQIIQKQDEQIAQMEEQHAGEMDEMRRKVAELEEENARLVSEDGRPTAKSLLSTAEELLPTIEKILADDDTALENAEEIELFKKLLELCEYLPEDEKAAFMASPVRMEIEYLIAKMSGTPGLLKTAQSLKKAGILGEEETAGDMQKPFLVTNHELRKVLKYMKELSEGLDDTCLADAMCNRIDNILERIELAENSIQIF
ncbi:MAG: tetratricopeptide repeat protein, partial [Treponema sp.]|nr:tetratricopeptide repeat protein [Treponema sp.]